MKYSLDGKILFFFVFVFSPFFLLLLRLIYHWSLLTLDFFPIKKWFFLFVFVLVLFSSSFVFEKKKKKRLVVHSFVRLAWPYQDEIWSNHSPTNDFYSKINKLLIKTLSKEGSDRSSFGHIIKDCKSIMGLLKTCFFSLVKRKGNGLPMP